MPETSADLSLLHLSTSQLLLLPGTELHGRIIGVGLHGRAGRGVACGADIAAGDGTGNTGVESGSARSAVLESVKGDSEMSLGREATSVDVPLLWTESTDEFFVVGNHNDTTFVVANGHSETTNGVTVQEIGRLVENEEMGVVLPVVSPDSILSLWNNYSPTWHLPAQP